MLILDGGPPRRPMLSCLSFYSFLSHASIVEFPFQILTIWLDLISMIPI